MIQEPACKHGADLRAFNPSAGLNRMLLLHNQPPVRQKPNAAKPCFTMIAFSFISRANPRKESSKRACAITSRLLVGAPEHAQRELHHQGRFSLALVASIETHGTCIRRHGIGVGSGNRSVMRDVFVELDMQQAKFFHAAHSPGFHVGSFQKTHRI